MTDEKEQEDINTAFNDAYIDDNNLREQIEAEEIFDVEMLRNMRVSAQYGSGKTNRKKFCAEMTPEFVEKWKDFVEVFTGISVKHGRGSVSSPLVQFSLQLFMAIVADLDVRETCDRFNEIIDNPKQMYDISERLANISEELKHGLNRKIGRK